MNVETRFATETPGSFQCIVRGVNLKATGRTRVGLPRNLRALVESVKVITRSVTSLSGGATVKVMEFDQTSPEVDVASSVTTAFAGSNNDLVFTAKAPGNAGDGITIAFTDPSANDATLSIEVSSEVLIIVNLATDGTGVITSTASQVKAAIEALAEAAALVTVAFAPGNDGTGVVAAAVVSTENGLNANVGEDVQTLVSSVALSNSAATDTAQTLTVASAKLCKEGSAISFEVTSAATATAQTADVLISGTII